MSTQCDVTSRFDAEDDHRITNKLIRQPLVEFDLAAQDIPECGIGAGLSSAEIGARLRYAFVPEFAPYIGIEYERSFGDPARFARAAGEDAGGWSFLVGLRSWLRGKPKLNVRPEIAADRAYRPGWPRTSQPQQRHLVPAWPGSPFRRAAQT